MPTPTSKRTTAPAYQHYASDFLSDDKVCRMSYTEIGVYQVLLDHSWLARGLPTETTEIAKMLKMPTAKFQKLWAGALSECFVERKGRLVNPRLERERDKQDEYRRRQSDNGSKGGRGHKSQAKATASVSLSSGKARVMKTEDPSGVVLLQKEKGEPEFDGQRAFMQLTAAYPQHRMSDDRMTMDLFFEQLKENEPFSAAFATMLENLENHKSSDEWCRGIVPNMENWLSKGKWKRRYELLKATGTEGRGRTGTAPRGKYDGIEEQD